uniref:Uncharacterized protein n=1 Tax=Meloidogyne hapla TaxID=6305 RepID=A0A1I8C0D8_MELHA
MAKVFNKRHVRIISQYILFNKNIQTNFFVKKEGHYINICRGFHQDDLKNLEITWDEMKAKMKERKAKKFFEETKSFFICEENNSCKINFKKIFETIKSEYLRLSSYHEAKLGK